MLRHWRTYTCTVHSANTRNILICFRLEGVAVGIWPFAYIQACVSFWWFYLIFLMKNTFNLFRNSGRICFTILHHYITLRCTLSPWHYVWAKIDKERRLFNTRGAGCKLYLHARVQSQANSIYVLLNKILKTHNKKNELCHNDVTSNSTEGIHVL